MRCPQCGSQKGKRACPALQQVICPVCCGTKRQVTIRCPEDCTYLAGARIHPPIVVARQQERDFRFALSLVAKLPERSIQLFFVFLQTIRRSSHAALPTLLDADVAEGASALAATLETAARGIIYDHQATSLAAQRLAHDLGTTLAELARADKAPGLEREAALVLRRIAEGAKSAGEAFEDGDRAFLGFVERLPAELPDAASATAQPPPEAAPSSRIIIP